MDLKPPGWDVTLVLRSLTRAPYKPLQELSDRDLTLKTVFLLALALVKRVGELHRLSFDIKHSSGWGLVTLDFFPDFVAKTQNASVLDARLESFTIPFLEDFVDNDPDEMLLCPVRVLQCYLKRTGHLQPECRRLFVKH